MFYSNYMAAVTINAFHVVLGAAQRRDVCQEGQNVAYEGMFCALCSKDLVDRLLVDDML